MSAAAERLARARTALADSLRHAVWTRRALGTARWALATEPLNSEPWSPEAVRALLQAARLCYPLPPGGTRETLLRAARERLATAAIRWDDLYPDTGSPTLSRAIILKGPGEGGEKGVLLVSFENQWLRLLRHGDLSRLAADYDLLLAPTWSPPYDLPMLLASRLWPGSLLTTVSNLADVEVYARWLPNVTPLPFMPSSWVHPALGAAPRPEVTHDLVMIANFAPYKRHFALFRAFAASGLTGRVRLVGVAWGGRTAADLRREAAWYGVEDRLDIHENAPEDEKEALVRSARAAVILTRTEGACVAAAEALVMDVPLGMLADAHVGSIAFVNEVTGLRLRPQALAADLRRLVEAAPGFEPRRWMLEHGHDCFGSTASLNTILRRRAHEQDRPWTTDVAAHTHVRLAPSFVVAAEARRLTPAYEAFPSRYGVTLALNVRDARDD
jgi:hypothetical protein